MQRRGGGPRLLGGGTVSRGGPAAAVALHYHVHVALPRRGALWNEIHIVLRRFGSESLL